MERFVKGFAWLFYLLVFISSLLMICGFIVMTAWNFLISNLFSCANISFIQGIFLAVVVIAFSSMFKRD